MLVESSLDELKAVDVVTLNITGLTAITDYMIIAGGTSNRHVRSIADNVIERAKRAEQPVPGVEGHEHGEWVLVDLQDVVVHIMQPRARDFYKLENLWSMDGRSARLTDAGQAG